MYKTNIHVVKYFMTSSTEMLLGRTNRMKIGAGTFPVGKFVGRSSVGRRGWIILTHR